MVKVAEIIVVVGKVMTKVDFSKDVMGDLMVEVALVMVEVALVMVQVVLSR
jgi:hypothetical protein